VLHAASPGTYSHKHNITPKILFPKSFSKLISQNNIKMLQRKTLGRGQIVGGEGKGEVWGRGVQFGIHVL
jgi:hypothetical protein